MKIERDMKEKERESDKERKRQMKGEKESGEQRTKSDSKNSLLSHRSD